VFVSETPVLVGTSRYGYVRRAAFWNRILVVVPTVAVVVALGTLLGVSQINQYLTAPVDYRSAVVLESSRPLNDVVKAPADWTGDGKPDGWAFGEYLPGDQVLVVLDRDGVSIAEPSVVDAVGFGVLIFLLTALFAGLAGAGAHSSVDRWAEDAAWRDLYLAEDIARTPAVLPGWPSLPGIRSRGSRSQRPIIRPARVGCVMRRF